MAEIDAFNEKFRVEELCISDTEHWSWSVRPAQPTLGATVLSLKRYAANFSDVTAAELSDMSLAIQRLEHATKTAFTYEKINYLMLMMVDPHVHFHVIPRYDSDQKFAGDRFVDTGWPAVPQLAADMSSDATLTAIHQALSAALNSK